MSYTLPPWRWEFNPGSKRIQLVGGKPRYDLIVMDFVRYGMAGAAPRFNVELRTSLNVMKRVEEFAAIEPGRAHHADWHRLIRHPDAQLIEVSPELYEALQWCLCNMTLTPDSAAEDGNRRRLAEVKALAKRVEDECVPVVSR